MTDLNLWSRRPPSGLEWRFEHGLETQNKRKKIHVRFVDIHSHQSSEGSSPSENSPSLKKKKKSQIKVTLTPSGVEWKSGLQRKSLHGQTDAGLDLYQSTTSSGFKKRLEYGMVPKGLLTFLGFLGDAEFCPGKRLRNSLKTFARVLMQNEDI